MLTAEELQTYIDAVDVADTTRNDDILRIALAKFAVDRLSYGQRVAYWRPRAAHVIMRLLTEEHDPIIHEYCWDILTASLKLTDVIRDDPSPLEEETMDWAVVRLGIGEAIARELLKRPPRQISALLTCLVPCTNICLCPKHVKRLIDAGVVHGLMNIVSDEVNIPIGARLLALISLTNIAIHPESHATLVQLGAVTTAIGLLRFLTSTDIQMVDVGLSAAFLICRVAGRDESGPGMESIHNNVRLISKLWWILDAVLRAGPNGVVLGSQ